jgi:hypothetical protein
VKLQTTFLQLLNPSVIILALLLSDSIIPLLQVSWFIKYYYSPLKEARGHLLISEISYNSFYSTYEKEKKKKEKIHN